MVDIPDSFAVGNLRVSNDFLSDEWTVMVVEGVGGSAKRRVSVKVCSLTAVLLYNECEETRNRIESILAEAMALFIEQEPVQPSA